MNFLQKQKYVRELWNEGQKSEEVWAKIWDFFIGGEQHPENIV